MEPQVFIIICDKYFETKSYLFIFRYLRSCVSQCSFEPNSLTIIKGFEIVQHVIQVSIDSLLIMLHGVSQVCYPFVCVFLEVKTLIKPVLAWCVIVTCSISLEKLFGRSIIWFYLVILVFLVIVIVKILYDLPWH